MKSCIFVLFCFVVILSCAERSDGMSMNAGEIGKKNKIRETEGTLVTRNNRRPVFTRKSKDAQPNWTE